MFQDPEAAQQAMLDELQQPGAMPPAQSSSSQSTQSRRDKPTQPLKEPSQKHRSVVRDILEKKRKPPIKSKATQPASHISESERDSSEGGGGKRRKGKPRWESD